MQAIVMWAGRLGLAVVLFAAFAGAIDPHHNAGRHVPSPDVVEHVAYGYLLTLLTIVSLPRVRSWMVGAGFLAVAMAFEGLQAVGWVSGTFQWKDVLANVGGVAAALVPLVLGRRRR